MCVCIVLLSFADCVVCTPPTLRWDVGDQRHTREPCGYDRAQEQRRSGEDVCTLEFPESVYEGGGKVVSEGGGEGGGDFETSLEESDEVIDGGWH